MAGFDSGEVASLKQYDISFQGNPLTAFRPVTESELIKLIKESPNKSCASDPIPTWLFKECATDLVGNLVDIFNESLTSGVVPSSFKQALVRPLLKKPNLEKDVLGNYRPVSNLPYQSKLLEKVVGARLEEHFSKYELCDQNQSAYRKFHSTETALLRVHSDIAWALDRGSSAGLLMLDLSAAFDTINHKILLDRLDDSFGVRGVALKWIESYLDKRTQSVVIDGEKSTARELDISVPQGSVLGPRFYCT